MVEHVAFIGCPYWGGESRGFGRAGKLARRRPWPGGLQGISPVGSGSLFHQSPFDSDLSLDNYLQIRTSESLKNQHVNWNEPSNGRVEPSFD
jgi:hypothetical protein